MSEDTPECAKLHHKKKFSREHIPPSTLAMCSKTRTRGDLKFPQK